MIPEASDAIGVCQRKENLPTPDNPSAWDQPPGHIGSSKHWRRQHQAARIACHNCPLLEPCERYLSAMERAGVRVSGVVAGRYSDLADNIMHNDKLDRPKLLEVGRQSTCRGCGHIMWPQAAPAEIMKPWPDDVQHHGEGLCHSCYPHLSRQTRRRAHDRQTA